MTDDDFKKRLEEQIREAQDRVAARFRQSGLKVVPVPLEGEHAMHFMSLGGEVLIKPGHSHDFSGVVAVRAFKIDSIGYSTDWVPDRLPWRWRNRFTRWVLRKIFRRYKPHFPRTPFVVDAMFLRQQKLIVSAGKLHLMAQDLRDPTRPIYNEAPFIIVAIKDTEILIRVTNTHPTRTANLWLGLSGSALS